VETLLLRPTEAAKQLSVGRTTLYELIAAGEIPVVRIGRAVRVPTAALRAWVDQRAGPAAGGDPTVN